MFVFNVSKKRFFVKHFDLFTFINKMNFIWRVWKTKMHNKITINNDHYNTNLIVVIFVIDWIIDEIDNYIQSIRDIDFNHFKNWFIMLKLLLNIYNNFDFKRNMYNWFRILIMNIQNFQSFYFVFFVSIIQQIISKLSKLKNWKKKNLKFEIWKK